MNSLAFGWTDGSLQHLPPLVRSQNLLPPAHPLLKVPPLSLRWVLTFFLSGIVASMKTFNPQDYTGTDDQRVQAAFRDACNTQGSTVYLPWIGRPYNLTQQVNAIRPDNDYLQLDIQGDPVWNLIDFRPTALGRSLFRLVGLKHCSIIDVMARSWGGMVTGFSFEGTDVIRSTGGVLVENCRLQPMAGTQHTGFMIGVSGDDFSCFTLRRCETYCDGYGLAYQDPNVLPLIAKAGHRGFVTNGGNTLANRLEDCRAVGLRVGYSQLYRGKQEGPCGGAGTQLDFFGTTACSLVYQGNGGFPLYARGGRHELGGALLSHGTPAGWEPAQQVVKIEDMVVDGFQPAAGVDGLYNPGAFLSLRSDSKYRFSGITMGDQRETFFPGLELAHNGLVPGQVVFDACQLHFDPRQAKVLAGQWDVSVDGAHATIGR